MAITQINRAVVSDELLQYIREMIKNGVIEWTDLIDTPDYVGQDGKYLKANSGGGSSSMEWANLPASGLNWQAEDTDVSVVDKIGVLASNGITITLPDSPTEGNLVAVADHLSEFDKKPVTIVSPNSLLIEGEDSLILDLRNAYIQLIFDGTQWELAQVNHPFNIQEITEESFPSGSISYTLSRTPPGRAAILVTIRGKVIPTSEYSLVGNVLSLGSRASGQVSVRHIGVPAALKVSDTPVGAMLYFPNSNPVDGWLDCTGGTISKNVYPDLVYYLTRDLDAELAYLPDSRGNFIRTWDHGNGTDSTLSKNIPVILKPNSWGSWLTTTDSGTSANLWDADTTTFTKVKVASGYVGYAFDAPVTVSEMALTSNDLTSAVHLPTSVQIKASTDGVTWIEASVPFSGSLQNRTINVVSTVTEPYRFWGLFGTGGQPYATDPEYYWGITSLVITGSSTHRVIGDFQGESVGPMTPTINGSDAGFGQVQSGSGADSIIVGGTTNSVSGGSETRPNNQAYVLRIKAFHYQSGALANSDVKSLRDEVSRLSTSVNDGTSYVSATAPVSPSENARWYDTTSGRTYIWFNDGDSYQWVDDSPQSVAATTESVNLAPVLATGSSTQRRLNDRFSDIKNVLDFGAHRNSTVDSAVAFTAAGAGPVFIPLGSYTVSSGDFTGNIYFSFGPVTINGAATGIVIKDLLA